METAGTCRNYKVKTKDAMEESYKLETGSKHENAVMF
jgi:hypothetical protein